MSDSNAKAVSPMRWKTHLLTDLLDHETLAEFGQTNSTVEIWELEGYDRTEDLSVSFPGADAFRILKAADLHQLAIDILKVVDRVAFGGERARLYSSTLELCFVFRVPTPVPSFVANAIEMFNLTDRRIDRELELSLPEVFQALRLEDAFILGLLKGELNDFATTIGLKRITTREEIAKQRSLQRKANDRERIVNELKRQFQLFPGARRKTTVKRSAAGALRISIRTLGKRLRELNIHDADWCTPDR